MSIIETITDVNNTFLSRREITCDFAGLAGKLRKLEAVDMITKEFKLDGKIVIPMRLKTHVGKPTITGIFYVYEDEGLAKKHVNPTIFSRLEKTKAKLAEEAENAETKADDKPAENAETKADDKPAENAETKADDKPAQESKEEEKSE